MVRNLRSPCLTYRSFLGAEKGHSLSIAGCTVPKGLSVKHVGASANGIEGNADGVDQKMVLRRVLYASHNLAVQEVFADQPARATQRRHHDVNLADTGQAMPRTRIRPVVVPRPPVFRAVLF